MSWRPSSAALDPSTPVGVFELTGPRILTADEFAQALNGQQARIRHLGPGLARVLAHVVPGLPAGLVDVMLRDTVRSGELGDGAERFGVTLHALEEIWLVGPRS